MPVQQPITSPSARSMFSLAILTGFGGPMAACLVAGLLFAAVFGTLARLFRSVAEVRTREHCR